MVEFLDYENRDLHNIRQIISFLSFPYETPAGAAVCQDKEHDDCNQHRSADNENPVKLCAKSMQSRVDESNVHYTIV
ncbi:hypothetical protein GCK72_015495 [Caenorhabditis remanei]|uniref:Uncharacterized protein n=1 Tax=Caenorhabditis remanei TaxID=31234 RepID=A0A6A5GX01_CAERE|nr:hypothetical protein GCK72_015495 [Caenorhabditis remanei]KAF1759035.1 hypothetical protein GCK72_015495 [Caenorhabditis remanei]